MQPIAAQLDNLIPAYEEKLVELNEFEASLAKEPGKWTRKEELGHLIDSAHTNLRRFIVSQYEDQPKIIYRQNDWVRINSYNIQPLHELIQLWRLLNRQVVRVLSNMPEEIGQKMCNTGTDKTELHSLKWLAEDYVVHMQHHLHHLLDLEPVPYG